MLMNIQRMIVKGLGRLPDSVLVAMSGGEPFVVAGRKLDPLVQLMRKEALKLPHMTTMSPQEARLRMTEQGAVSQPRPRAMESITDVSLPGPAGDIPCRLLVPHGAAEPSPLIVFFHMGGCVIGDIHNSEPFCTILAQVTKARVLNVGYRLAPEHPFPAAVEDALAAYRGAFTMADEWGVDPKRFVVAGESAGGLLSAVISQTVRGEETRPPCAQVLIFPWLDALADNDSYRDHAEAFPLDRKTMDWFGDLYFNDASEKSDFRASPGRNPDLTGLPRALVYTAGFDPLHDEGKAYAEAMKAAGNNVSYYCFSSLCHSFTALGGVSKAALRACEQMAEELRGVLNA